MVTLSQINQFDQPTFVATLGFLFEGSPWIAERTWHQRPFADATALHTALCDTMRQASEAEHLALIRAHPDLAGKAALAGDLTPESTAEQASVGLDRLNSQEYALFQQLNNAYQHDFGFPFIICVREHTKQSILAAFEARLTNSRSEEIATALGEIAKIAWLRLVDRLGLVVSVGSTGMSSNFDYTISYGKKGVPVYRVYAKPLQVTPIPESPFVGSANILFALEIDVEVFGNNFLPAYTHGDNSNVVATDSMKNFILRETLHYDGATLEGLLYFLGQRLLTTYVQMENLRVTGRQLPFSAAMVPGSADFAPSQVLFSKAGGDYSVAAIQLERLGDEVRVTEHHSGRMGMYLMKITGSAFTQFVRDGYTTLPERGDRPLYIATDVTWTYTDSNDLVAVPERYVAPEQVRDLLQTVFDRFVSESIQHLFHEMGMTLLNRCPQLQSVSFTGYNLTRDPVASNPENPAIKVYTDPFPAYGQIRLTMQRS
jgi:urate oxidase/2-oxo-4-hydroxy-4-carboxy-5-ureidoimidazoline decarboxylase